MTADSWDDFAADWDKEPGVRKYADMAFESWQRKAAPLISSMAETRVLDFGCGTRNSYETLLYKKTINAFTTRSIIASV